MRAITAEEIRQIVKAQTEGEHFYMGRPLSELSREELVYAVIHLGKLLQSSNAPVEEPPFPVPPIPEILLRRCTRCGERIRVEGETVLCDGVVSKLAPLSVHEPVAAIRYVEPSVHLLIIGRHTGKPIGCMHNPDDDAIYQTQKEEPGCTFREVKRDKCPICLPESAVLVGVSREGD